MEEAHGPKDEQTVDTREEEDEEAGPYRWCASEKAEGVEGNASEDFPVRVHVHHKEDDEEKPDVMM